jgi:hypothetical protein
MIERMEAGLIFSKWRSEESLLFCRLALLGCELNAAGRIVEATNDLVVFRSLNGDVKFRLHLNLDDMAFWFATPRELLEPSALLDEQKDLSGIGVAFPLRVTPAQIAGPLEVPERDKVIFLELPRDRDVDMDNPRR